MSPSMTWSFSGPITKTSRICMSLNSSHWSLLKLVDFVNLPSWPRTLIMLLPLFSLALSWLSLVMYPLAHSQRAWCTYTSWIYWVSCIKGNIPRLHWEWVQCRGNNCDQQNLRHRQHPRSQPSTAPWSELPDGLDSDHLAWPVLLSVHSVMVQEP